MSKIVWDATSERLYETGTDRGVLYPQNTTGAYPAGVAWNGLTGVSENPSGGESNEIYADNTIYLNLVSTEKYEGTIKAYTYPDEFEECDGSASLATGVVAGQQGRRSFGFSYRTKVGNDVVGDEYGYKIHLVYGCKANPSSKDYQTINDSPEAIEFSWDIKTIPVECTKKVNNELVLKKPTAHLVIDSTKINSAKLAALEDILYGVDASEFSTTSTYAVGDHVTHESKLYVCSTAVTTAGAWDASDWTEVTNAGPRLPLPDEVFDIVTGE